MIRLRQSAGRETGSAYLVTLLVMLVLTITALSVSVVTQMEQEIGANELSVARVFYAADTGIALSTARALVRADYVSSEITVDAPTSLSKLDLEHQVEVSAFYPILNTPCNLCEVNNAGQYGSKTHYKTNHAVTSQATRVAATDDTPLAFKTVTAMMEIQPWDPPTEAFAPANDPEELAKIKY